jgi:uncharacterized FlgJ-related protein
MFNQTLKRSETFMLYMSEMFAKSRSRIKNEKSYLRADYRLS